MTQEIIHSFIHKLTHSKYGIMINLTNDEWFQM
jgi:hypothetical protein